MKRLLSLALLGAVALVVPVANAQMRGGGMMGGHGGGVMSHGPVGSGAVMARGPVVARGPAVAGGFAARGPVGAPRVSPAFVTGRPASGRIVTRSGHVFFGTVPSRFHHHHFFFFPNCFGTFPCNGFFNNEFFNNGFLFGSSFGWGWPFWGYPSYPYNDYTSAPPQQAVSSDTSGQVELAREVQQLSDQIEALRYEEGRRAQQKTTPVPSSSTSLSARTPAIATTFVMRDGRAVVAENYALTGQTLWIFDEHKARKIALSDIDREATEKFNAANGIEIRLP